MQALRSDAAGLRERFYAFGTRKDGPGQVLDTPKTAFGMTSAPRRYNVGAQRTVTLSAPNREQNVRGLHIQHTDTCRSVQARRRAAQTEANAKRL
ncbi:MAG: hypothetical protein AAGA74_12360 [Pseudomonadota bacterium]